MEQGADPEDHESYGKKNVAYELTDERFYLEQPIVSVPDVMNGTEEVRQLTCDDYEIEYVDFRTSMSDAEYDTKLMKFITKPVEYTQDDIIHIYAKANGSDEWAEAATYSLFSGELWYDNTYVSGLTEERIVFKPNCTGYRFTASNAHYYTSISATPYCRIKNSGYVMQQIEDKERVTLGNIASVRFTDHAGNVFYSRDMYAEDYIIGIVRESLIEKTTTSFSNNKIKKYVTVGWRINANESYMTNDGRRYIPQESGTFYDLLPLGCDLVRTSVLVKTERGFLPSNAYDVSSRINYNGTGRILLTVHIKEQFERAELLFSTTYTYENILDYGKTLNNSAAFETGNDRIANGQPDNGGNLTDKSYMTDLDPETDEPLFIYTQHSYNIRILTAATSGLTKTVKGTNEYQYVESTKVRQNGEYSYKLRYATTTYTRAKDMVLFDSLENFSLGGTAGDWHGVLTSVDVTQVTDKGAAPVVYFSSVEDLDINSHNDLEEEISGERVWIKASRFGDISRARAVAVDMRKDAGGNDFILDRNSSVAVILYMKAPEEDNTGVPDPTTYNNIFMKDTLINMLSDTEESFFIHYEHAEVHFRIMADVSMLKLDSSDHKTPVGGIEFTLSSPTGKTDYGTDFPPISKTTDKYGRLSFADIEKGTYILSETAGSDDYLQNIEAMEVVIDGRGTVTIKGSEIDPDVPQIIEDDPRVHTDIEFYKRDLKNRKIVHGSEFVLSGKSIYGTDVYVQAVSDENGCVFFPNIEESDTNGYELREVKAADGYVRSETVFTVMIDDNANYSITEKDAPADGESLLLKELDGTYSVFNEPLHSFVLQKVSYMSEDIVVEGAEFRLYGYSDYGHEYDKTDTTNERGQITFDGLEAGTYTLRELAAPEGYILDSRDRTVIVTRYGECTVSDTTTDNMGRFVVTNKPDGTVTVIKKWLDNETNVSRAAKGIDAIISISSEAPENSAYFGYVISPNESNGDSYSSILTRVAPLASIISFAPYKGPRSYVTELINEGKAVRIDDETTNKQIYAWFEEDTGAVYWWTNAKTAKMSSRSHQIWNGLTNAVSIDVTDIDTSEVTDMSKLFYNCVKLQSIDISTFDTSNVNDMTLMFGEDGWNSKASLTEIIFGDSFNTSKVTSMTWMFAFCTKLSVIDLSRFDTHNVQSFNNMFLGCAITEADISSFDTSNALYMSYMFAGKTDNRTGTPRLTKIITGPGFDTSNVRYMNYMFYGQNNLDKDSVDFTKFDTRNVTNMKYMFRDCSSLDELDLSSFDTSSLNTMYGMFYNCSKLKSIDLSSFTTPELTSLYETFYGCSALEELDMSAFNTSKVTTLAETFLGCSKLEHIYGLNGFDTSRVTTLNHTFRGCTALIDADVSRFDTSSVTNMAYAFCGCNSLPVLDVSGWDTSNVLDMAYMFDGCSTVEVLDVSGFDTRKVYQLTWSIADGYSGMGYMFRNCRNVRELDVSHFYTRSIYHMEYMFSGCASLESLDLSSFDTSNIIDMCRMFEGCSSLKTLDLSSFDTSNVAGDGSNNHQPGTGMACMFSQCTSLESVDLSSFDTSQVRSMAYMFYNCKALKSLDLTGFDTTNVVHTHYMFYHCESLKTLDLSSFSFHSVNEASNMFEGCYSLGDNEDGVGIIFGDNFNMSSAQNGWHSSSIVSMFKDCRSLKTLDLSSFGIRSNNNINSLFSGCTSLKSVDLSGLQGNYANLSYMFDGCSSIEVIDLTSLNTPALSSVSCMFRNCSSLKTIYVSEGWSKDNLVNTWWEGNNCFTGCTALEGGGGTSYATDGVETYKYAIVDDPDNGIYGYFTYKAYTKKAENAAYIDPRSDSLALSATRSDIRSFAPFDGTDDEFRAFIEDGTAVRIDNTTTNYAVYTVFDSTTGAVRWWSDAEKVYLLTNRMWYNLEACTSIDTSGLDFSKLLTANKMFYNCKALTDLDLSGAASAHFMNTAAMFYGCKALVQVDISELNTANVKSMEQMFYDCTALISIDLGGHDVSQLVDAKEMFYNCQKLTEIDFGTNFNSVRLRDMSFMFYQCKALERIDLTKVDSTSLLYLDSTYHTCSKLNSVILGGSFKAQCVETMYRMFYNCTSLDEIDLSMLETQSVRSLSNMFMGCTILSSVNLGGGFDTRNVENMAGMFQNCSKLPGLDTDRMNTVSVERMEYMFYGCSSLQSLDLSVLNTPKLVDTSFMLYNCSKLSSVSLTGSTFKTDKVRFMQYMFYGCSSLTSIDLSDFETDSTVNTGYMFYNCKLLTSLDLSSFDTTNNRNMQYMFANCQKLEAITFGNSFKTANVVNMEYVFGECHALKSLDLRGFDTRNVTNFYASFYNTKKLQTISFGENFTTDSAVNMESMFNGCKVGLEQEEYTLDLSTFRTKHVNNMKSMLQNCDNITKILMSSNFTTDNVTTFSDMFNGCKKLTSIDLSSFDSRCATTVANMFNSCYALPKLELPEKFSMTAVVDMTSAFQDCSLLTELDLSGLEPLSAKQMRYLFNRCSELRSIDFGTHFDTSRVFNMTGMFQGCVNLKHDPEGTDTEAEDYKPVIDISFMKIPYLNYVSRMFLNCDTIAGIELGKLNTARITKMQYMFYGCDALTEVDLSDLRTDYADDMSYMFDSCLNLTGVDMTAEVFRQQKKNMNYMFQNCKSLQTAASLKIGVSYPDKMKYMFNGCSSLTVLDLSGFDTSSASDMEGLFQNCTALTKPELIGLTTVNAGNMSNMFSGCTNLEILDLSCIDTGNATTLNNMFNGCKKLKTIYVSPEKWILSAGVTGTGMFNNCQAIEGGNGQTYLSNKTGIDYAHIDAEGNPGYLTDIAAKPRNTSSSAAVMVYRSDGEYDEVKCTVVKLDDSTWEYTYTGLDPSLEYYAWEDEIEGYISSNTDLNPLLLAPGNNTITNTTEDPEYEPPEYGRLTVRKLLEAGQGTDLTEADLQKTFTFSVFISDENEQAPAGVVRYPIEGGDSTLLFVNGKATTKLRGGESLTITDIPEGYHYLVEEIYSGGYSSSCEEPEGIISADAQARVEFVNTKEKTVEDRVSFTLKKIVEGNYELTGERYSFSVMLGGLAENETYTLSDGSSFSSDRSGSAFFTVSLADQETVTVNDLPAGSTYRITEAAGDYSASYRITDANGSGRIAGSSGTAESGRSLSTKTETADTGEDITVTFVNTRDARQDLVLRKRVIGDTAINDDEFEFTVEFTDLPPFETVMTEEGGIVAKADSNGSLTAFFTLKNGDTLTFLKLPVKTGYIITEGPTDYIASYSLVNDGTEGTVVSGSKTNNEERKELSTEKEIVNEGEEITVTFTNRKVEHDITVTKLVDMTNGIMEYSEYSKQRFDFLIELSGLDAGEDYYSLYSFANTTGQTDGPVITAMNDGTAELHVQLRHGQSLKIKALPVGAKYQVTEKEISGYAASYSISGGDDSIISRTSDRNLKANTALTTAVETVEASELDVRILFTNTFDAAGYVLPDSGMKDMRMVFMTLFSCMAVCALAYVITSGKKRIK